MTDAARFKARRSCGLIRHAGGASQSFAPGRAGVGALGICVYETGKRTGLAKGWADTFDQTTRLYQFALQARAGRDALASHVRAALELRPGAVLVSSDGRSAYDSMSRAAFLTELRACAPELLPRVRFFYSGPSTYCWRDAGGYCRDVAPGCPTRRRSWAPTSGEVTCQQPSAG